MELTSPDSAALYCSCAGRDLQIVNDRKIENENAGRPYWGCSRSLPQDNPIGVSWPKPLGLSMYTKPLGHPDVPWRLVSGGDQLFQSCFQVSKLFACS